MFLQYIIIGVAPPMPWSKSTQYTLTAQCGRECDSVNSRPTQNPRNERTPISLSTIKIKQGLFETHVIWSTLNTCVPYLDNNFLVLAFLHACYCGAELGHFSRAPWATLTCNLDLRSRLRRHRSYSKTNNLLSKFLT